MATRGLPQRNLISLCEFVSSLLSFKRTYVLDLRGWLRHSSANLLCEPYSSILIDALSLTVPFSFFAFACNAEITRTVPVPDWDCKFCDFVVTVHDFYSASTCWYTMIKDLALAFYLLYWPGSLLSLPLVDTTHVLFYVGSIALSTTRVICNIVIMVQSS